jgi:predicted membrane channel-forming protein YqfA (hemolysin III family)
MALKGASTTAADFKLVGYVFMLIAAWFTCGIASIPFLKALEGETPSTPLHVMIFLVLGWLFLFLGHYKSRRQ